MDFELNCKFNLKFKFTQINPQLYIKFQMHLPSYSPIKKIY